MSKIVTFYCMPCNKFHNIDESFLPTVNDWINSDGTSQKATLLIAKCPNCGKWLKATYMSVSE